MSKHLVPTLCILLTAVCAGMAMGTVAVSVDASKSIGPFNPICRDFGQGGESADPDYLRPLIEPMRALKPRLIRLDHVLNHCVKAEVKDGKMTVDFTALDKRLEIIRAMGAEPLMCLSFSPMTISGQKSNIDPPNDLKFWEELVYRVVKYVNGDRKLGVKYWELWNEPNLRVFWTGNREQFLELYEVTEKAVIRADPTVKFGGAGYYGFPDDWIRAMAEQAKSKGLRMDFISWHVYKDSRAGVEQQVTRARALLKELGLKSELIVDEWNYNAQLDPGNDDHNGAVIVADMICRMTESGIDRAPFFEIKDGSNENRYWGRWGLFTADHHPKASYYAFLGFAHMEGNRLSFAGAQKLPGGEVISKSPARIGGMAVGKGKTLDVVLYNTSLKLDETVDLTISGLGKSAVRAHVYRIDETHSNPARTGRENGLEQVDEQMLSPKNGVIRMNVTLPRRSVAFVRL